MKAVKLFGAGDLRLTEGAPPVIASDEILLKTAAAAICGTDLRMIQHGAAGVDEAHPLVLGHEISGVICAVGEQVIGYSPGMRVVLAPNMGCGVCDRCVSGDAHLCTEYRAFGVNLDGGFAEYVRIPSSAVRQGNLLVLDENADMGVSTLLEPLSCVINGQEQVEIQVNDVVLVIGAGPIGLMHAMLAKLQGAARVLLCDLSEERLVQCQKVFPDCIPVSAEALEERVGELTGGRGVDVCITACPSPQVQAQSLSLMAMNGRILFFGGLPAGRDQVQLSTNLIHYRQLKLCGSTRGNIRQFRKGAALLQHKTLDLRPLVSARYPLTRFEEAVTFARSGTGLKTIITFE